MTDYLQYYDLEKYLFEVVKLRFHAQHYLSAADFFCIIIWKSNRAKSTIAKRLLNCNKEYADLEHAVKALTTGLAECITAEERLRCLLEKWGFKLPMASAILTVLYPQEFTVYDYRVCDAIGACHDLQNKTKFESVWQGYLDFRQRVESCAPAELTLRDKDRFLWGKSFWEQLNDDVTRGFSAEEIAGDE